MVYFGEWTTSWHEIGAFYLFSGQIRGASGPLGKVDHWLARNRAFYPIFRPNQKSQWSTPESGPLAQEHMAISLSKFIG